LNSPWKSGSARIEAQASSACFSKFSKIEVALPEPISTHLAMSPVPSAIYSAKFFMPLCRQASPSPWNTAVGVDAASEKSSRRVIEMDTNLFI